LLIIVLNQDIELMFFCSFGIGQLFGLFTDDLDQVGVFDGNDPPVFF